ncbi:MAG: hypothetical protein HYZ29_36930 [Myxococcales bacterium]|nr:hypothetical protein [Myxococcales bacterium]
MAAPSLLTRAKPWLPWAAVSTVLAVLTVRTILAETGGEAAVPLDDSFIHFQYAKSFAAGKPLAYSPGAAPTPGATSLLWPMVLGVFHALGLGELRLVWVAWVLGFVSLSLLAMETHRLALGLVSRPVALAAGAMVPAFGGLVWCAGSGMEVVPFAWLLVWSARLAAEQAESSEPVSRNARITLVLVACAAQLMRPEGAIALVCAAVALVRRPGRGWAALPLAGLGLPALINWLFTGQAASTTALSKWLPFNPYHQGERLWAAIRGNFELLFGTLFDGQVWSAIFIPAGGRLIAWLALPALVALAFRQRRVPRGAFVVLIALGMLIPASFDCMLCNRLRYLWPFAPGWFIALAALCEGVGLALARFTPHAGVALAAGLTGAFASQLSPAIDDVAHSADAIRRQQSSLGRWARDTLPKDAIIGVNDTGAIAYFSGRRTFDVVGLTTKSEPRYWAAGAGSRFEHYERLPRHELPTHFIVYPEWMAVSPLMGEALTSRTVDATILGGKTMTAYLADYAPLLSAERPLGEVKGELVDRLDVADLESEAAHGYALFWATQPENRVHETWVDEQHAVDGGRAGRTLDRFTLAVRPRARLVARVIVEAAMTLELWVDGRKVGPLAASAQLDWQELALELPPDTPDKIAKVELAAPSGQSFTSLHYFVLAAP